MGAAALVHQIPKWGFRIPHHTNISQNSEPQPCMPSPQSVQVGYPPLGKWGAVAPLKTQVPGERVCTSAAQAASPGSQQAPAPTTQAGFRKFERISHKLKLCDAAQLQQGAACGNASVCVSRCSTVQTRAQAGKSVPKNPKTENPPSHGAHMDVQNPEAIPQENNSENQQMNIQKQ